MTSPEERFWQRVKKTDTCWLWTGKLSACGYGSLLVNGRKMQAHRFSYFLFNQENPTDCVLHSCDVRHCVNPDHLRLGTQADNMRDMVERGRQSRLSGTQNPKAKFSKADIAHIRTLINQGETQKQIAARFGVNQTTISCINRGRTWSTV